MFTEKEKKVVVETVRGWSMFHLRDQEAVFGFLKNRKVDFDSRDKNKQREKKNGRRKAGRMKRKLEGH